MLCMVARMSLSRLPLLLTSRRNKYQRWRIAAATSAEHPSPATARVLLWASLSCHQVLHDGANNSDGLLHGSAKRNFFPTAGGALDAETVVIAANRRVKRTRSRSPELAGGRRARFDRRSNVHCAHRTSHARSHFVALESLYGSLKIEPPIVASPYASNTFFPTFPRTQPRTSLFRHAG